MDNNGSNNGHSKRFEDRDLESEKPAKKSSTHDGDPRIEKYRGDPWEKQDGESAVAFEAFVLYRDMGVERGQHKVAEQLSKSRALMGRWSRRWKWVERADAWDREQDRLERLALNKERRAAARRHASQFKALQTAALKFMEAKFGKAFDQIDAETMTIDQLIRIFDIASKGERLSLGEPETTIEHQMNGGRDDDDERQPIPLTFSGRIDEALALLETARTRAASKASE